MIIYYINKTIGTIQWDHYIHLTRSRPVRSGEEGRRATRNLEGRRPDNKKRRKKYYRNFPDFTTFKSNDNKQFH